MYYLFLLKTFQQQRATTNGWIFYFICFFYPTLLFHSFQVHWRAKKLKGNFHKIALYLLLVNQPVNDSFFSLISYFFWYIQYRKKIPLCLPPFFTTEFSLSLISLPIFIIAYRMEQKKFSHNSLVDVPKYLFCMDIYFLQPAEYCTSMIICRPYQEKDRNERECWICVGMYDERLCWHVNAKWGRRGIKIIIWIGHKWLYMSL